MTADSDILAEIDAAFGSVGRPEHFTEYTHCCECAEHDELLRSRNRETLSIEDVGNPGWDPLCFSSPDGMAFYFPTLARFALAEPQPGYGWYADQLLFHLYAGFTYNRFFGYCSPTQRQAITHFLAHLIETRPGLIDEGFSTDDFLRCHELWSDSRYSKEAAL
jgi:hypothetical protein